MVLLRRHVQHGHDPLLHDPLCSMRIIISSSAMHSSLFCAWAGSRQVTSPDRLPRIPVANSYLKVFPPTDPTHPITDRPTGRAGTNDDDCFNSQEERRGGLIPRAYR